MRVISGQYKGAKLISPRGQVRPTTDMVKGSLFSSLYSLAAIDNAKCLDVFCGSGALGIEALSRGASECVFIDLDTSNVLANLDKLKLRQTVIKADFRQGLKKLVGNKFDLIFCDPPYGSDFAQKTYELLAEYNLISSGGFAILEHSADVSLDIPTERLVATKKFGISSFDIVRGGNESDFCGNV